MGKDSKDTFAVDTRNRSLKQWGEGLFALFVGLTIARVFDSYPLEKSHTESLETA